MLMEIDGDTLTFNTIDQASGVSVIDSGDRSTPAAKSQS